MPAAPGRAAAEDNSYVRLRRTFRPRDAWSKDFRMYPVRVAECALGNWQDARTFDWEENNWDDTWNEVDSIDRSDDRDKGADVD